MAESDDRLARDYRALAREEPPPALDAAILAAARASVRPRVRNRWAGPLSVAAVLVLGLGVALRMQVEQPGIETSLPAAPVGSAETPAPPQAPAAKAAAANRANEPEPQSRLQDKALGMQARPAEKGNAAPAREMRAAAPGPKLSREAEPSSPPPAREKDTTPSEPLAKKRSDAPAAETLRVEPRPFAEPHTQAPAPAAAPMAPPPAAAQSAAPPQPASPAASAASPAPARAKREISAGALARDSAAKPDADERIAELERIARLRSEGRHVEADKALDDFRRLNPDYRIPEAQWERVKPR